MAFDFASRLRKKGRHFELLVVGPKLADEFLATMGPNRHLTPAWVDYLADCMANDRFLLTNASLAFDDKGRLRDGQHRLQGIVKSGKSIEMAVAWNLGHAAIQEIDTGRKRSEADQINVYHTLETRATNTMVATARAMYEGLRGDSSHRMRGYHVRDITLAHIEPLSFCREFGNHLSAPILAPAARAWYEHDRNRIAEFLRAVRTNIMQGPGDCAAGLVRIFADNQKRNKEVSSVARSILYRKTESGLLAFLEHRPINYLQAIDRERFPMLHEVKDGTS